MAAFREPHAGQIALPILLLEADERKENEGNMVCELSGTCDNDKH